MFQSVFFTHGRLVHHLSDGIGSKWSGTLWF